MANWKFKDPNKKSNRHKFERIVKRHELPKARHEAFQKFKRHGDSDHVALVKCLNSIGIKEQNKG